LCCFPEAVAATSIRIRLKDRDSDLLESIGFDVDADDTLGEWTVPLPALPSVWTGHTLKLEKQGELEISVMLLAKRHQEVRQNTTQMCEEMGCTEEKFELEGGKCASLVSIKRPGNTNAVLWLPGRNDTFMHPHVAKQLVSVGFDVFSLDPRDCGRAMPSDKRKAHHVDDFDAYFPEMQMTRERLCGYEKVLLYAHSTGAVLITNYLMAHSDNDFDGFILNSPFFDWGHVGGEHFEWGIENMGFMKQLLSGSGEDAGKEVNMSEGTGEFSSYFWKHWMLHECDPAHRQSGPSDVTSGFSRAVTRVHERLESRKETGLTSKPTLVLASKSDTVLDHNECLARASWFCPTREAVLYEHHPHDVTLGWFKEHSDAATNAISEFAQKVVSM